MKCVVFSVVRTERTWLVKAGRFNLPDKHTVSAQVHSVYSSKTVIAPSHTISIVILSALLVG